MDAVQATLTVVAALAASAYAVQMARSVERARNVTGTHTLSRTIRRARYEIAQQMPLDIAARVAAELSLIPPLEVRTPDIHAVVENDEAISNAAGLVTEAIDALRASLAQGWRLVANPAIQPRVSGRVEPFLFDGIVEGPPGRLPCLIEAKVTRHNQSTSNSFATQLYRMNQRTKELQTATGQEFQQVLLAVVEDPNDAMSVRQFLKASRGVVEPSNTFVGSYYRKSGLDFATTWPPFARPGLTKDATTGPSVGGLTA